MSRSAAAVKRLLPALTLDARDMLQAEDFSGGWQSGDALDELCDDVLRQCQLAVAQLKRTHNASLMSAKLPPEVWCGVWSWLADEDYLVRVTHVCSSWRTIATGHPPLWTRARFWTTVHARSAGHGMCECPDTTDAQQHNLDQLATWLKRSKAVPIRMEVIVYPVFAEAKLALRLAKIVRPHAHRITHLTCVFGDVSFFVDFMQCAEFFSSLRFLRMSRRTYFDEEHNTWPFSKLQLHNLDVSQLQEFRGYADFIWNIESSLEAPTFPLLQRLRCDFDAPRMLFECLRCCPRLVFLNSQVRAIQETALPPTSSDHDAGLAPALRTLILDCMTPQWASLIAPVIHRPSLTDLTLRYSEFADTGLFSPFGTLSGAVELRILLDDYDITARATNETGHRRFLDFSAYPRVPRYIPVLARVWNHVSSAVSHLTITWALRAALLNTSLRAPRLSCIRFARVSTDPGGTSPTIAELTALNAAGDAGRPDLPALSALEFCGDVGHSSFAATAKEFAAALSDSALKLEFVV